jgi:hypothetical protein
MTKNPFIRFNTIEGDHITVRADMTVYSAVEFKNYMRLFTSEGTFEVPGTRETVFPIIKETLNVDLANCQEVEFPWSRRDSA